LGHARGHINNSGFNTLAKGNIIKPGYAGAAEAVKIIAQMPAFRADYPLLINQGLPVFAKLTEPC
jgi:hypothetical protein